MVCAAGSWAPTGGSKDVLSLAVAKFMGRRAAGSCSGRGQPQKDAAATAAAAAGRRRSHAHMRSPQPDWGLRRARPSTMRVHPA